MCSCALCSRFWIFFASDHHSHLWSYFVLNRSRLLSNLKYVVVDEGHAYKGKIMIAPLYFNIMAAAYPLLGRAASVECCNCAAGLNVIVYIAATLRCATTCCFRCHQPPPWAGVFGCHTALVLRRLRRLCDRVYHSQVGCCMASRHARLNLIAQSGAASGHIGWQ